MNSGNTFEVLTVNKRVLPLCILTFGFLFIFFKFYLFVREGERESESPSRSGAAAEGEAGCPRPAGSSHGRDSGTLES